MFLLYDKYFAMRTSFKISLLYLMLIIPHYGNSPLPLMESWLQKDQDDGFVQRDMTSSLTGGDESFGSAHQNYKNSLIRKKKSDNSGDPEANMGYKKFVKKFNQNPVGYNQPEIFFDGRNGRFVSGDYNGKISADDRNDVSLDDVEGESNLPSDRYGYKLAYLKSQSEDMLNPAYFNKVKNGKYVDVVPSKDVMAYNRMGNSFGDISSANEANSKNAKWSFCKRAKEKYSANQPVNYLLSVPRENRDAYQEALPFPIRNLENVEGDKGYRDNNGQYKEEMRGNDGGEISNENDYYDAEMNPAGNEGDSVVDEEDYGQILNDRSYINKREGSKQEPSQYMGTFKEPSDATKILLEALRSNRDEDDSVALEQMAKAEANQNGKTDLKSASNSDLVWQLNSNLQTDALRDVVRNSQKALKEVQLYQQKLGTQSLDSGGGGEYSEGASKRENRNSPFFSWDGKNARFDEKRLKREDEDEQKNMKTGTDEGGGGEYEDEEGKGHKDEEEYYEDADLSDDESGNDIRPTDNFNQKYVKRDINRVVALKNADDDQNENASPDYEFNVENAPVEHAEKSRKSLHGEGEKTKKNSARKGVKVWDQWGKWSPCSVTCGVGRSTRWRHCIGGGCAQGEKEAQIKRCTNPAC